MSFKLFFSSYTVSRVLGITKSCYREQPSVNEQKREPRSRVGIVLVKTEEF